MNRMIWPSASWISLRTALRRSSNSPRYFEPAISAPMSSATTRRSLSCSGTSPETMRWARPSAIAVLPTPGSPIRTGLFFVRRASTWMTRRISSSRPMTGSSLPSCAACVRSRPNFSSDWYLSSGFSSVTRCGPRTAWMAATTSSLRAPLRRSASPAGEPWAASESSRCSVDTYSSWNWPSSRSAARRTATSSRLIVGSVAAPWIVGSLSSAALTSPRIASGRAPSLLRTGTTMPSSCSSRTARRCSGVVSVWLRAAASEVAASSAPRDLVVNRSRFKVASKNLSRVD